MRKEIRDKWQKGDITYEEALEKEKIADQDDKVFLLMSLVVGVIVIMTIILCI